MSDRACPQCGATTGADYAFCVQCGVSLENGGPPTLTNLPRQQQLAQHGQAGGSATEVPASEPPISSTGATPLDPGPGPSSPLDPDFVLFRDEPWTALTPTEPPRAEFAAPTPQPPRPAPQSPPPLRYPEAFVPQMTPPPAPEPTQQRSKGTLAVAAALSLALLVGVIFFAWTWLGGDKPPAARATTPTTVVTPSPSEQQPTGEATAPSSTTPATPAFQLPAGAKACEVSFATDPASKYQLSAVGNASTTCPFAEAVRQAYLLAGGEGQDLTVTAYSPSTKKSYSMTCRAGEQVYCEGGNNAVVILYR